MTVQRKISCTVRLKALLASLYWDLCLIGMNWNQIRHIAEICLSSEDDKEWAEYRKMQLLDWTQNALSLFLSQPLKLLRTGTEWLSIYLAPKRLQMPEGVLPTLCCHQGFLVPLGEIMISWQPSICWSQQGEPRGPPYGKVIHYDQVWTPRSLQQQEGEEGSTYRK